jgi:hypothetical protein
MASHRQTASYGTVTVTTVATLIRPQKLGRLSLTVLHQDGAAIVYVGFDASVTTAAGGKPGFPLTYFMALPLLNYAGPLYGILDSGSVVTHWFEV